MGSYLNVGLMQSSGKNMDFESCLDKIEKDVNNLMSGMNRPEIIFGVEMGIGRFFKYDNCELSGDTIPGRVTDRLSETAKKYSIYFAPGSMLEKGTKEGKDCLYNSMPIFAPDGSLIDVYRKICPYLPVEEGITPGDRYVTFDIKEKNVKVGVMICHDWCFPEISRNLALEGAEILFRPAIDPEGLYEVCRTIPQTRAFENQCYFISLNMCGEWLGSYAYGHSMVAAPDGHLIYEAGENPACLTLTLDIGQVKDARKYGTCYTEQLLRQLPYFNPPMDVYNNLSEAPLYKTISKYDNSFGERDKLFKENGLQTICKSR
ncbi:MAG: carbon-nitrogen hydrolase family protein [Eubacteriales bacterium]|nr:carbon-nitrogen hydrolase family protein [Eubacteriales bacterium]